MTAIPQMEWCMMLGIDPKTLRNWRESCASPLRCSSHRCTPQMVDARASPAVGEHACSPHRATCRRFSGAFAPFPHSAKRDSVG